MDKVCVSSFYYDNVAVCALNVKVWSLQVRRSQTVEQLLTVS